MKKPLDRITEAYFDSIGTEFGDKVRKRVHWICERAKGEEILDIGCSQGITTILLAREGKHVLGIDLLQESIDYANTCLKEESEITQKYAEFTMANFMDVDFGGRTFDTIIMGEVLEHITDTARFIKKGISLLNEDGQIIITVPFGINDYFDHKKTYYLTDLLALQIEESSITEVRLFGKWAGLVLKKKREGIHEVCLDETLIKETEGVFNSIERENITRIITTNRQLSDFKKQVADLKKQVSELKNEREQLVQEKQILQGNLSNLEKVHFNSEEVIKELTENKEKLERIVKEAETVYTNKVEVLEDNTSKLKSTIKKAEIAHKKDAIKLKEELLVAYQKEEKLLGQYLKQYQQSNLATKKLDNVNKRFEQLNRKYHSLSTSKLGKLTLKYWGTRKRLSGGK